jgi:hypothetical protein
MTFLNPITILKLNILDIEEVDYSIIKKAKKRLFADIDLSDTGSLNYLGQSFSRSEIEYLVNQLDDVDLLEIYFQISQNPELEFFLSSSDGSLFNNFNLNDFFYKRNVISFISPFYTESFNKIILDFYLKYDSNTFGQFVSLAHIIDIQHIEKAYKSLINYLKEQTEIINDISSLIREKEGKIKKGDISTQFNNFKSKLINTKIKVLPSIFQSSKNECALVIRRFSNNSYNRFEIGLINVKLCSRIWCR